MLLPQFPSEPIESPWNMRRLRHVQREKVSTWSLLADVRGGAPSPLVTGVTLLSVAGVSAGVVHNGNFLPSRCEGSTRAVGCPLSQDLGQSAAGANLRRNRFFDVREVEDGAVDETALLLPKEARVLAPSGDSFRLALAPGSAGQQALEELLRKRAAERAAAAAARAGQTASGWAAARKLLAAVGRGAVLSIPYLLSGGKDPFPLAGWDGGWRARNPDVYPSWRFHASADRDGVVFVSAYNSGPPERRLSTTLTRDGPAYRNNAGEIAMVIDEGYATYFGPEVAFPQLLSAETNTRPGSLGDEAAGEEGVEEPDLPTPILVKPQHTQWHYNGDTGYWEERDQDGRVWSWSRDRPYASGGALRGDIGFKPTRRGWEGPDGLLYPVDVEGQRITLRQRGDDPIPGHVHHAFAALLERYGLRASHGQPTSTPEQLRLLQKYGWNLHTRIYRGTPATFVAVNGQELLATAHPASRGAAVDELGLFPPALAKPFLHESVSAVDLRATGWSSLNFTTDPNLAQEWAEERGGVVVETTIGEAMAAGFHILPDAYHVLSRTPGVSPMLEEEIDLGKNALFLLRPPEEALPNLPVRLSDPWAVAGRGARGGVLPGLGRDHRASGEAPTPAAEIQKLVAILRSRSINRAQMLEKLAALRAASGLTERTATERLLHGERLDRVAMVVHQHDGGALQERTADRLSEPDLAGVPAIVLDNDNFPLFSPALRDRATVLENSGNGEFLVPLNARVVDFMGGNCSWCVRHAAHLAAEKMDGGVDEVTFVFHSDLIFDLDTARGIRTVSSGFQHVLETVFGDPRTPLLHTAAGPFTVVEEDPVRGTATLVSGDKRIFVRVVNSRTPD